MATERTRQLVLGAMVLALVVAIIRMWPGTSAAPAPASNRAAGSAARQPLNSTVAPAPPAVHLEVLNGERPKPEPSERNLFRFKQKAPPAPPQPAPVRSAQPVEAAAPAGPPPSAAVAPITLKFIGIVETASHEERIAILSDGRNAPFYGKEGAIIEGRYRILKIGVESVEIAYADGRGRQTIRLTGS
ncbi:MAG: hypothetical protein ACRD2I_18265 [Vicinamibacterales bacterium]